MSFGEISRWELRAARDREEEAKLSIESRKIRMAYGAIERFSTQDFINIGSEDGASKLKALFSESNILNGRDGS